jgi:hypothetical protein
MNKPFPALCRECKYSEPDENSSWSLHCIHPVVNGNDPYALASKVTGRGTDCHDERKRKFFAKCGMSGKRWEAK